MLKSSPAPSRTYALTYSLRERLYHRLLRRWPRPVVERRLLAHDLDVAADVERRP
jgi:hypothetical protein